MLCMRYVVVLVLTWRSAVVALQLGLDEVQAMSACPDEVDTCKGSTTPLSAGEYVSEPLCQSDC